MNQKVRRCPKCGGLLELSNGVWQHIVKGKCNYERQAFIKPETPFLFLNIKAKDEKTQKFLEDIMQRPETEVFKDIKEDGTVFVKERLPDGSIRILDVTTIQKLCDKMAREIREQ